MMSFFNSMKGRAIAALVAFLGASHLLALLVYVDRSENANNLLHDALVAEQIALVARLVENLPDADRARIIGFVDTPSLRVAQPAKPTLGGGLPEGTRPHNFEHLLSAFLDLPIAQNIRLAYSPEGRAVGLQTILHLGGISAAAPHDDLGHVPQQALAEIASLGTLETEVMLRDTSWLRFDTPLLSVSPFSTWKFGLSLLVGLLSVMLAATWVMVRWTQPLTAFARAAERLGRDIKAPPLSEHGPFEVRAAAQAFNRMQQQLRRLIDDRTQLAAAIAHDLGTPITRLRLRAEDIESEEQRAKILGDLDQMQRMMGATLDFARQDLAVEPFETLDLSSLLQSLCDDLSDMRHEVALEAPAHTIARLRPYAVRRALSNVIENAVKYGKRARVRLSEEPAGTTIVVDDDGPGIPERQLGEVFKPFRRLEQQSQEHVQGAGLGLTVARTIARDHGGDIELIDRPEGGLRVRITLPRHPVGGIH
jgi:signal transduction histidine kinase